MKTRVKQNCFTQSPIYKTMDCSNYSMTVCDDGSFKFFIYSAISFVVTPYETAANISLANFTELQSSREIQK